MRRSIFRNEFEVFKGKLNSLNEHLYLDLKHELFRIETELIGETFLFLKPEIKSENCLVDVISNKIEDIDLVDNLKKLFIIEDDLDLPPHLLGEFVAKNVVLFIGAGASVGLGYPNWWALGKKAIKKLESNGQISKYTAENLLNSNTDPKQLLSVFEGFNPKETEECKGFYEGIFKHKGLEKADENKERGVYDIITDSSFGGKIITTNIDEEVALAFNEKYSRVKHNELVDVQNGDQEVKDNLLVQDEYETLGDFRFNNKQDQIVYLHGSVNKIANTIFTIKDYSNRYFHKDSEIVAFLEYVFNKYTVLFIGYGLAEFTILESILNSKTKKIHYSLEATFLSDIETIDVKTRAFKELNVSVIPYYRDNKDYARLLDVLESWMRKIINTPNTFLARIHKINEVKIAKEIDVIENSTIALLKEDAALRKLFLQEVDNSDWLFSLRNANLFCTDVYKIPDTRNLKKGDAIIWEQILFLQKISELEGFVNKQNLVDGILIILDKIINSGYCNYWVDDRISLILGKVPQEVIEYKLLKTHLSNISKNPFESQKSDFWSIRDLVYNLFMSNSYNEIKLICNHLWGFVAIKPSKRKMKYEPNSFIYNFKKEEFPVAICRDAYMKIFDNISKLLLIEGKSSIYSFKNHFIFEDTRYSLVFELQKSFNIKTVLTNGDKKIFEFKIERFYDKSISEIDLLIKNKLVANDIDPLEIKFETFYYSELNLVQIIIHLFEENYQLRDLDLIDLSETSDENDILSLVKIYIQLIELFSTQYFDDFRSYIGQLFDNKKFYLPVFKKVGLYFINLNFKELEDLFWENISCYDFLSKYEYNELTYNLLNMNSQLIGLEGVSALRQLIVNGPNLEFDYNKEKNKESWQLKWVSIFKDNPSFNDLYEQTLRANNGEVYSHRRLGKMYFSSPTSPYSISELGVMSIQEIVQKIEEFEPNKKGFNEPDEFGFASAIQEDSNRNINKYVNHLDLFLTVENRILSAIIESIGSQIEICVISLDLILKFFNDLFEDESSVESFERKKMISNIIELLSRIIKTDNVSLTIREMKQI